MRPVIKSKELNQIGKKEGLFGTRLKVYNSFFRKRFPREFDSGYAREWAQRFRKGTQWNVGDTDSRKAMMSSAKKFKYPTKYIKIEYGKTSGMWYPTWREGEKIPYINEKTGKMYYK